MAAFRPLPPHGPGPPGALCVLPHGGRGWLWAHFPELFAGSFLLGCNNRFEVGEASSGIGGPGAERPVMGLARAFCSIAGLPQHLRALDGKLPGESCISGFLEFSNALQTLTLQPPTACGASTACQGPWAWKAQEARFPGRKLMQAIEQEAPYRCSPTTTDPLQCPCQCPQVDINLHRPLPRSENITKFELNCRKFPIVTGWMGDSGL